MTIVEFTEKILDMKLYSFQKKYLEMLYEKYKQEGELIFLKYPRDRWMCACGDVAFLHTLAGIYFRRLERGELDDDKNKQVQT